MDIKGLIKDALRCPLDPGRGLLLLEKDSLICERCGLTFPIKDDIPIMVVEEATLPKGCESISQLPCQREGKKP